MRFVISLLPLVEAGPSCLALLSIDFCCSGRSSSSTGSVRKTFCIARVTFRESVLLLWACSLIHLALFFVGVDGIELAEPVDPGLLDVKQMRRGGLGQHHQLPTGFGEFWFSDAYLCKELIGVYCCASLGVSEREPHGVFIEVGGVRSVHICP